ncbi:hypothetical protein [Aliiroseovarius sediminis]|uniref:hypothetical protein n=1 Tax=Aliiroseovarius sediminis TaxID=2925839 RepID=UPI001F5835E3|nr:hypothetical protein [Aliiroseovarius sediminis]MCI2393124.1 hypothetical protein [Aliiroseovarius sediminis]
MIATSSRKIIRREIPSYDQLATAEAHLLHDRLPEDRRALAGDLLNEGLRRLEEMHVVDLIWRVTADNLHLTELTRHLLSGADNKPYGQLGVEAPQVSRCLPFADCAGKRACGVKGFHGFSSQGHVGFFGPARCFM